MFTSDTIHLRQSNTWKAAPALVAVIATLALNHPSASAQTQATAATESEAVSGNLGRETARAQLLFDARTRVRFEKLSEQQLKAIYRACSREAIEGRLGSVEIAYCSVAYEVLLGTHFAGDYGALQSWSAALRD